MRNMYSRRDQKKVIFRLDEQVKEELYARLYKENLTSQEFFEKVTMDYIQRKRKGDGNGKL